MSDNLPLEMQSEIMKKLPVKSLLQFRSVSKSWKSLIDSSHFIAHYDTHAHHILVACDDNPDYASIVDDHTFPHQGVSPTVPSLVYMLWFSRIIGNSHGLLCMHGVYPKNRKNMALLLNLSIRRAIPVVVPNVAHGIYETAIGFGVCRETIDPKIVKITYVKSENEIETITSIPWQVEVFTLSTGVWRRPYSSNILPRKSIHFGYDHRVVVDGNLYWLATDRITTYGGFRSYNLVISFDLTSEEFKEVKLPDSAAHDSVSNLSMYKLRESLVVVQHDVVEADNPVIVLWMMEGTGVAISFVRLLSVNVSTLENPRVRGFRKSGELILEISENYIPVKFIAYDPYSKRIDYLGIEGACAFLVYPYVETLLLLDQPNLEVYDEMETVRFLDDLVS